MLYSVTVQKGFTEFFKKFKLEGKSTIDISENEALNLSRRKRVLKVEKIEKSPIATITNTEQVFINNLPMYDVAILTVTKGIGRGGGQQSLIGMATALRMSGYRVDILDHKDFSKLKYPNDSYMYIVCSNAVNEMVKNKFLTEFKDRKKVCIVNCVEERHITFDLNMFDTYICNSEFTAEFVRNKTKSNIYIQNPTMMPEYAKIRNNRNKDLKNILLMEYTDRKGKKTFDEVSKLLPDFNFIAVDYRLEKCEYPDTVHIISPTAQTHRIYENTSVLVMPNEFYCPEAYGRVAIEAIGNGIPVVANPYGNLIKIKEKYPDHVFLIDDPLNMQEWADKIIYANLKQDLPTIDSAWNTDHSGILACVQNAKIFPRQERQSFYIDSINGVGDEVARSSTLRVLNKIGDIYLSSKPTNPDANGRAYIDICPYIKSGNPPIDCILLDLRPVSKNDPEWIWQTEPRYLSMQRRAFIKLDSLDVDFCYDKNNMQKASSLLKISTKKRLGICFWSAPKFPSRTMPIKNQEKIINSLVATGEYEIYLINNKQTFGDSYSVTDTGGKLSMKESIHFIKLMDVVLSVDTGTAHISCAQRIPTVALMGPVGINRHIQFKNGYTGKCIELCLNLDCQPCWCNAVYGCNEPGKCLAFEPDIIIKSLKEILNDRS